MATLVGPATAPLQDISGGGWTDLRRWSEPPPKAPAQERRKFLHRTAEGLWLVKFAGFGRVGRAKLERARGLHAAGLTPEPAGLAEGFLVERWVEHAGVFNGKPLALLARHLAFRQALPAEPEAGASLPELAEMLRVNVTEALSPAAAGALRPWPRRAAYLEPSVRRVHVDGRLHRWEWLVPPSGRPLKSDALDHSGGHDLVGAQDITWDIAGAELEFDLTEAETERLRSGLGASSALLRFMRLVYPAFQLGLWAMAAQTGGGKAAQVQADRYAHRLKTLLQLG